MRSTAPRPDPLNANPSPTSAVNVPMTHVMAPLPLYRIAAV